MGEYRTDSKQAKIIRLLSGFGFRLKESNKHIKAYCPKTGDWTLVPRHKTLSPGVTESICDFLIERGYDEGKIKKAIS